MCRRQEQGGGGEEFIGFSHRRVQRWACPWHSPDNVVRTLASAVCGGLPSLDDVPQAKLLAAPDTHLFCSFRMESCSVLGGFRKTLALPLIGQGWSYVLSEPVTVVKMCRA